MNLFQQGISTTKQQLFPVEFRDDQFKKPTEELRDEDDESDDEDLDLTELSIQSYIDGRYSPVLLQADELNAGIMVLEEEEDYRRLDYRRKQVIGTGKISNMDIDEEFEKKARETTMLDIGMDEQNTEEGAHSNEGKNKMQEKNDDDSGAAQEVLIQREYLWSDKYRPRKPRYFNRVHTGYDWNQYNKKHYDVDNPPPKTVQGYKFNVRSRF